MKRWSTSGDSPSSLAYAGRRAAASRYRSGVPVKSDSTTTYSMSRPTMTARLAASVHGVVVQIRASAPSAGPLVSRSPTVTAGSTRGW